jgi:RNA polymerase sigma factor (TIGR02999 family)
MDVAETDAEVTRLLSAYSRGDRAAINQLMPLIYVQLKRLARTRLQDERAHHTLSTTGLVHEAYLRLVEIRAIEWQSRNHFLAIASQTMRRILVSYARRRKAAKRGGGVRPDDLDEARLLPESYAEALFDLDESIIVLEEAHPRQAMVVQHRYFGGLTNAEIADILNISLTTVERDLRFARAWIAREWSSGMSA